MNYTTDEVINLIKKYQSHEYIGEPTFNLLQEMIEDLQETTQ